jgi:hypothetical protein
VVQAKTEEPFDNGRFGIWLERRSRGGDFYLIASQSDGVPFQIDSGGWNLSTVILDEPRLIYIKPERASVAVMAVDLTTRRVQKLFSLQHRSDPHLLDMSRDGKQFVYTIRGACDPGSITTNGALLYSQPSSEESLPQQVCVADIR